MRRAGLVALLLAVIGAIALLASCATRSGGRPVASTAAPNPPPAPAPTAAARTAWRDTFASPLAAYSHAGSKQCAECHDVEAAEWKASSHASTLRAASSEDEDRLSSLIPCSDMGVSDVLGGHHQLRFLLRQPGVAWGEGRMLALPCAWNPNTKEMEMRHAEDWRTLPFETRCAPCHVTGQSADWSFPESGVGCESCHGPGSEHVNDPSSSNTFGFEGKSAAQEVTVCASCHLQGGKSKRTGYNFPDEYVPGGSFFDDFEFDWDSLDHASVNEAIDVHQKKLIRSVILGGDSSLRCTSCHALHGMSHEKHQALPRQDFCNVCHQPETNALKEYRQSCPVCEF